MVYEWFFDERTGGVWEQDVRVCKLTVRLCEWNGRATRTLAHPTRRLVTRKEMRHLLKTLLATASA